MTEPSSTESPRLHIADDVATITLARERHHNRIDPDDLPILEAQLARVEADQRVRALVVTGSGQKTFSSGYTLTAIVGELDTRFEHFLDRLETFPLPTICALNGSVYGGATDLALCCDFRVGVADSRMFMPAAKIGLHYYPGGMRRYITALGLAHAKRLFLTGMTLDAEEMLRIGFLTDLVERDALEGRVQSYLNAITQCAPSVVGSMKQQLNGIAAGDAQALADRTGYEGSLKSDALRERLEALNNKR